MSNPVGNCSPLQDASGLIQDSSGGFQVLGIGLKSALTGSLTVSGVNNLDGTAASWVIPATSTGWQAPAGNSSGLANRVSYVLSNPGADAGKAVLCWLVR